MAEPASTPAPDASADASRTREVASLTALARSTRAARGWNPAQNDLTTGRNAHRTNTLDEMRAGLEGDHNWLEGDLRVRADGTLVLSHDADKTDRGLTLDEWLRIGGASERGLKIDVKEPAALPGLLDAIAASGVPDGRIMLNVAGVSEREVREMRERFPDAWLALNPALSGHGYRDEDLEEVGRLADAAGGRIAFPVRWDCVDDRVIAALKPHGKVSIWTDNSQGTPDNTEAERSRLIERGVDGVIDLGPPQGWWDKLKVKGFDLWESNAVRGGIEVAKDGVGLLRAGASHLPLVGGWFD